MVRRIAVLANAWLIFYMSGVAARAVAQGDIWIGREVLPKPTCAPKIEGRDVPLKALSLPMKVSRVSGDWLWVGRAWVKKRDVVTLKEAGNFYTEYLRKNPQSSWGFACRAAVHSRLGAAERARRDIDTALRLDPTNLTVDIDNVVDKFAILDDGDLMTIPVTIDGHGYEFAVDTGSSCTVVDSSLKSHLVLTDKKVRVNHRQTFDIYDLPDACVGSSQLKLTGDAVCSNLEVLRKFTGRDIRGIIGMSFLSSYVLHVEFDSGFLAILKHVPESTKDAIDISYPWAGLPTISVEFPGQEPVPFIVDLGMTDSSQIEAETFDRLVDSGHAVILDDSTAFQTIHGTEWQREAVVRTFRVGHSVVDDVMCNEGQPNALGLNVLSRFVITFDFPNNRLFLKESRRSRESPRIDMSGVVFTRKGRETKVEWVCKGGPAIKAGLQDGDQLICFNGKKSFDYSLAELRRQLSEDGRCVQLVVRREGELRSFAFRLSDWQKKGAKLQDFENKRRKDDGKVVGAEGIQPAPPDKTPAPNRLDSAARLGATAENP